MNPVRNMISNGMKRFALATGAVAMLAGGVYAWSGTANAPLVPFSEKPVRVLFAGDMMLDRNVARSAEASTTPFLFAGVAGLFADADVRVANLEGTITDNPSIARRNNQILRFTFEPEIAQEAIQTLKLDAVSLANNHALDFYEKGYTQTQERLEALGVKTFGHPLNSNSLSGTLQVQGKVLCFVGYHSLFDDDTTPVVQEIQTLRPICWRVLVFAHWGEEYKTKSNAAQQAQAHSFIDAGADLVIGAHPHVVQEVEVYQGRAIFYSLGNFMFDQNFSWETTHSLAVRVDLYEHKTQFVLTPLTIAQQRVSIAEGPDRQKILDLATVADFSLP